MSSAELSGKLREQGGKSAARKVRREDQLPAVLYGLKDNLPLKVNPKELGKIIEKEGQNVLIKLSIEGDSTPERQVILKEFQSHPLQDGWIHVDFLEIDMQKKTHVSVPIRLVGHSPGEKLGGLVNHATKEIEVECLPGDIPEAIEVNMAEVQMGDVVHVRDLSVSDKIEILDDLGNTVVSVYIEKVKEEEPAEGEAVEGEEAAVPAATEEKPAANK